MPVALGRWLRPVVAALAVYFVCAVAVGPAYALVVTLLLVLAIVVFRAVLISREAMLATLSWLLTMAVVSFLVVPARLSVGEVEPIHASAYALPLAAAFGPFALRRHLGDRGVTAMIGHVGCLLSTALTLWSVVIGATLGVLWVVGVLLARSGGLAALGDRWALFRHRFFGYDGTASASGPWRTWDPGQATATAGLGSALARPKGPADRSPDRATLDVGAELMRLPAGWTALHSREVPGSREPVDHLVLGESGVFVVGSHDVKGSIRRSTVRAGDGASFAAYTLDGSMDGLLRLVEPSVTGARRVAGRLDVPAEDLRIVVCFTRRMRLSAPHVVVELRDIWDPVDGEVWHPQVHLLRVDVLADWILDQPALETRGRGRRRRDPRRYARELAVVADRAFRPSE